MDKVMYNVEDIAADLLIPPEEAEKLLKSLTDRMEKAGHLTIRGMVPRAYFEKQKEAGFLLDESAAPAARIPLNEKRLLEHGGVLRVCWRYRDMHRKEVCPGDWCRGADRRQVSCGQGEI